MHHRTRLAAGLAPTAAAIAAPALQGPPTITDRSPERLPLESLQGRSMDAEFADLNADGLPDLIVASEFGQNIVLFQARDGFASSANRLPRGRLHDSEDIAVGDFDGDGRPDVFFAAEDDQTHELYLQTAPGEFRDASDRLASPGGVCNAVLAMDVDGDGDLDLILGARGPDRLLLNDGDARFSPDADARLPAADRITQDIEAGDIDGDGDPDLLLATEQGPLLFINNGLGAFHDATAAHLPPIPSLETREIDLGDVDGDGDLDLVLACVGWKPGLNPINRLLLNDGAANFSDATATNLPSQPQASTLDIDLVDLDADGDLDMVVGNINLSPLQIWHNDGAGTFTDATAAMVPALTVLNTIDVEVLDLDGDGTLDIYLANHAGPDRWLTIE